MPESRLEILRTDNLTLRVFSMDDLDDLAVIEADPAVMRYQISGVRTRDKVRMSLAWFIQLAERDGFSLWAVEVSKTGEFVGYCGLIQQSIGGKKEFELAYELGKKHWNRGYATEAAIGVRDWAFKHLKAPRVISIIDPSNVAAVRVAEKAGMRYIQNVEYAGKDCRLFAAERPQV